MILSHANLIVIMPINSTHNNNIIGVSLANSDFLIVTITAGLTPAHLN